MATLRGLLFDKDGTLVDYLRSWGPINRVAAKLAAAGDDDLADRLLLLGGHDPRTGAIRADSLLAAAHTREIAGAWVAAGSPFAVDTLTRDLDALFTGSATAMVPVTDIAALFGRLKAAGFAIGIASSDSEAAIRGFLAHVGASAEVDFVAGYDSGHGAKPGPGMLHGFCHAVGLAPAEVAVIGDNLHDMAMGAAGGAGLKIAVLTGTGARESLSAVADLCLASIEDLERALADAPVER